MHIDFLKQGFITFVLFNILNISFAAAVHVEYAVKSDNYYVLSTVILYVTGCVVAVSVLAMQLTNK